MMDETRVVLIKPGDVLLIGGVTLSAEDFSGVVESFRSLGLKQVAFFADDIEIGKLGAEELRRIAAEG